MRWDFKEGAGAFPTSAISGQENPKPFLGDKFHQIVFLTRIRRHAAAKNDHFFRRPQWRKKFGNDFFFKFCAKNIHFNELIHKFLSKTKSAMPMRAKTPEMIQKRIVIFGSGQPIASKWWWIGVEMKIFLPRSFLE